MGKKDGLKNKYHIQKADGSPCSGRYFVLKIDSDDLVHGSACRQALQTYANAVRGDYGELAFDILDAIDDYYRTHTWDVWDERIGKTS